MARALTKFTPGDWGCYSGAERFAGGGEPLIGEILIVVEEHDAVVESQPADVIVHGAGVIVAVTPECMLGIACPTKAAAVAIAKLLPHAITEAGLHELGFADIG